MDQLRHASKSINEVLPPYHTAFSEIPQVVMLWVEWFGRLKGCETGLEVPLSSSDTCSL